MIKLVKLEVKECNLIFNILEEKLKELKHDIEEYPEEEEYIQDEINEILTILNKVDIDK